MWWKRILHLLIVVWGAVTIVFLVGRVLPANPALVATGPRATSEMLAATEARLGLNQPLFQQYRDYWSRLLRGDLGVSLVSGEEVADELRARLPASLELIGVALLQAGGTAFVLAIFAASRPGGVVHRLATALVRAGTAIPAFLLAVLLIYLFYTLLPWAPAPIGRLPFHITPPPSVTGLLLVDSLMAGRWDALKAAAHSLMLPAITLAVSIFPQLFRVMYEGMATALRSDAILAARIAGVRPGVLWWRYILPLAMGPSLPLLAATFGYLIGGTVFVEHIFAWNGLGSYVVRAIGDGDYPAVQAVVLVSAVAYSTAFFVAEATAARVDPRGRGE